MHNFFPTQPLKVLLTALWIAIPDWFFIGGRRRATVGEMQEADIAYNVSREEFQPCGLLATRGWQKDRGYFDQ